MAEAERDADDWQTWFDRHQAALLLLARQHIAAREEAQDAVQEGFIRFWRSGRGAKDRAAYVFMCVRSAAIDARRSALSRRRRERDAAANMPLLVGPVELDERRRLIEGSLAALPVEQREAVVLKIWSELTFAQIGDVLGIPANTAASRYRYAIERLQVLLNAEVIHE